MQYDSLTYLEMRGGEGLLVYLHSFIPWGCCKHLSSTLLDEGPKVSNYNRTLIIISSDHFLIVWDIVFTLQNLNCLMPVQRSAVQNVLRDCATS